MIFPTYFESKKTLNLYELFDEFNFLRNIYKTNKLPNTLMFSGKKGSGKSTLINHFLFSIFDKNNYDINNFKLINKSNFFDQFINNIFSNIIYISGSDFKNVKIEDLRHLKKKIFKTSILNSDRFIIFDDVELFNISSLNALLKIIEEPSKKNYFFLINNETRPILKTIKSRCLEIKILLNEKKRIKIIESLISSYHIDANLDYKNSYITPGNFLKFNFILKENNISLSENLIENLTLILNIYKKNKEPIFTDLINFTTDYHFINLLNKNTIPKEKIISHKNFVFDNISKFFLYNLNPNTLLNVIDSKINDE